MNTIFARKDAILCNLSIVAQDFLPQDRIEKLHEFGSLLAKSDSAIYFIWKFCFRNHNYYVKIVKGLRVSGKTWRQLKSQILTLCRMYLSVAISAKPAGTQYSLLAYRPDRVRILSNYTATKVVTLRESWFNIVPHIFWEGQRLWWPFLRRSVWLYCVEDLVWHLFL